MREWNRKQELMEQLLARHGLDALLLQSVGSFAWATCGSSSYINTAATNGAARLLVTSLGRYLITTNIEAPRFEQEEGLGEQGWVFEVAPWYELNPSIARLTSGLKLGADGPYPGAVDLSAEIARMRANLQAEEVVRFRELGRRSAEAMGAAIHAIHPGQTEHEIASHLACEAESRGVQAVVNLVATDERVFKYRHPLPTDKIMDRYAMLVLCGRKWGLITSLTRLAHFGTPPDEIRHKAKAVAHVDATLICTTRPGRSLGQVFQRAIDAYERAGYPGEWKEHHQGGPVGYEPREWLATPQSEDLVVAGQVYAWNPSIAGTKSEDTMLVGEETNEILTVIDDWPMLDAVVDGQTYARPAILEVL